ncbi:TPA: BspA family leucine-rich repeat surface protein, partial [Enterococcus faecalis]|nr:BspA family leucine-rich repeat surface protein [Enterococcus faecalis]
MLLPVTVMAEEAKSEELNKKETTVLPENKIDMETSDENLKNNEQIPSGEINITDNSDGVSKTEVTEQEQEENNIVKTSPEKTEISTLEASTYANSNGWEYTDKGTYCVITAYSGTEKDLVVPNEINGKPTKITSDTFHNYSNNPESVTIQAGRFGKVGVEGSSLRGLFSQIRSLKSVDLSGLDTSNVTDMGYMFQAASALTSVNLNGLNTSNVRQMDYMFDTYASGLTTLDLSSFDTSNVVDMGSMFMSSTGLQTVN